MIEAVLKPRWKHDLERAKALVEALGQQLKTEDDAMSGGSVSESAWDIADELHDILVRYFPEGHYDDDE